MSRGRTQSDVLSITYEFLAQMLGARRTTVTVVTSAVVLASCGGEDTCYGRLVLPSPLVICIVLVNDETVNTISCGVAEEFELRIGDFKEEVIF